MDKLNKPYKACDPLITIQKIRDILSNSGIFLHEKYHEVSSTFYSCRLIVGDNGLENLYKGTNGKGLTPIYSLASAYGEFMERLQNNFLFSEASFFANKKYHNTEYDLTKILKNEDLLLDFEFDPDENFISYSELTENQKVILNKIATSNRDIYLMLSDENKKGNCYVYAPFYCLEEKKTEYLPIQLMLAKTGSNGMCAGNTKKEALIQGFCEIFERYVAKIIFRDELSLPNIPIELFQGTKIYNSICKLVNENNLTIYVKDCSLNLGFPVIGMLMIDNNSNTYTFNLGSDPSPIIALERCFTEIFQGDRYEKTKQRITFESYCEINGNKNITKNNEFFKFIINGEGVFPSSILSNECSYEFGGLNWDLNKSDNDDLLFIIKKIEEIGESIYIRDVSFLGFPSYYIYVTGMSEVVNTFNCDEQTMDNLSNNGKMLYNLKNKTTEKYEIISHYLEHEKKENITLFPYNLNEDNFVNRLYLLSLLFYRISDYKKAFKSLDSLLKAFNPDEVKSNIYLCCARDYIYFKSLSTDDKIIIDKLSVVYDNQLVEEVSSDLKNNYDVFNHQHFPTCFNCYECGIRNDCKLIAVVKLLKNIQKKHIESKIDQNNTGKLLNELINV